ncbi:MAG: signal peptidase I [Deinococcales bacterium]
MKWSKVFVIALALSLGLYLFVFSFARVEGNSMSPHLETGDWLLLSRYEWWLSLMGQQVYRRGDIVALDPQAKTFWTQSRAFLGFGQGTIKRIIALEGDHLRIEHGKIYLNAEVLAEPYLVSMGNFNLAEIIIPKGEVFVIGDNRQPAASRDSRQFGPVPVQTMFAKLRIKL